jgi:hypothetical protein
MKKLLLVTNLIILFSFYCFSQEIPIGNDVKEGGKAMKSLMISNGFTFFKEKYVPIKSTGEKYYEQSYKEEITLTIWYNEYDNIECIWFNSLDKTNYARVKKKYNSDDWKYIYSGKTILTLSNFKYYIWKEKYHIKVFEDGQINISIAKYANSERF